MNVILVTGATDGIGLATARQLFELGHKIFVHGRNEKRAEFAIGQILAHAALKTAPKSNRLVPVWGDLSEMSQVVSLARQVEALAPNLSVLINNAGVYMDKRVLSKDGFEMTFAVNHLAVHLLTHHLLSTLRNQNHARVVTVSSMAHSRGRIQFDNLNSEKHFDGHEAYATSKLMNILFTRCLAALNKDTSIRANSLHPGVIDTKLLRAGFSIRGDTIEQGCQTSVCLATDPELEMITGKYFVNCKETIPSRLGQDDNLAVQLWKKSEEILKPWC